MMSSERIVVLVEPLLTGSRLQIVANFISALRGVAKIILITRKDYKTDHYIELIENTELCPEVEVVVAESNLDGAWMRNLTRAEFHLFFSALKGVDERLNASGIDYQLVFMALDDYLGAFLAFSIKLRRQLHYSAMLCVKYRVEYLFKLNPGYRFRSVALRIITNAALRLSGARLVAFDERIKFGRGNSFSGILPDPWFGDFSGINREAGRALLNVRDGDFVLLTLGKQDRRKGIDFLLGVAPELINRENFILAVIGRIEDGFKKEFEELKAKHPHRVIHINLFVPEADLSLYFAAADIFLLPYSRDFTATSGTLSRASASGVPVLATSHGLVGYRVATYGLGSVFEVSNKASFLQATDKMYSLRTRASGDFKQRLSAFSERMSLKSFEFAVKKIFTISY
jgi:glycosyltransferase involved in cell wall biosynthesis